MRNKEHEEFECLLPSCNLAMTTPLPALAENTNPAFATVNIAKPLAFWSTLRGMTPSSPLLRPSTNDWTGSRVSRPLSCCTGRLTYFRSLVAFLEQGLWQGCVELHERNKSAAGMETLAMMMFLLSRSRSKALRTSPTFREIPNRFLLHVRCSRKLILWIRMPSCHEAKPIVRE